MTKIKHILARELLDSRGNPTVGVLVELVGGVVGEALVPSGASTGKYEAHELRDEDKNRYGGKGVLKAAANVNTEIAEKVVGMDAEDQEKLDEALRELDGTNNKSRLGANAILGVSLAACAASAKKRKLPLYRYIQESFFPDEEARMPIPMFNILNGGAHASSGLSIQEFKIIPRGIDSYQEQLRAGSEIFHALKKSLERDGFSTGVGDEGGFAPKLGSNTEALDRIVAAAQSAGYIPGGDVSIGMDVAASFFYEAQSRAYVMMPEGVRYSRELLISLYRDWMERYPIVSIEDGLEEGDWDGWESMQTKLTDQQKDILLIGDDLLVTNAKRLRTAVERGACNSALIKPNQIGTLTETIETILLAKERAMTTVVSHRSGETIDTFIADLAVGSGSQYIKTGSLSRGERLCKYNRLLEIEGELITNN